MYEPVNEWTVPDDANDLRHTAGFPEQYIQYRGVWDIEELYDVDADPLEVQNLMNDPCPLQRSA